MPLSAGDDFYIYVEFSAGGHPFDRSSEVPVLLGGPPTRVWVDSAANPGESFYRDGGVWTDLNGFNNTANFCIKGLAVEYTALELSFPDGLPEYLDPGVAYAITIDITDVAESYVPDSGLLHYRYDGGDFLTTPIVPDGESFRAVLPPADCDNLAEFYFSAMGAGGTPVQSPSDAPTSFYTAQIGELAVLFTDNFESDLGWTVSGNAADGQWDRGVPVGGGERGDPPTDYDGSGACYLTDNVYGNSDVDDGYTYLMSPALDLAEGDADISFALWYTNNFGGDPNNDLFKIYVSNDGGGNWTLVETVGPGTSGGWYMHAFTVGDFVTPTANVKVRFEASDLNDGSVVEAGLDAFTVSKLVCEDQCFGDLDGDNDIDLADLAQLLSNYGMTGGAAYEDGDLDGDGDVDLSDLAALLAVYGTSC